MEKKKDEKLFPVEELKESNNVSEGIFRGTMVSEGWMNGKMVTEKQFTDAVNRFRKRPIGGDNK